MQLYSKESVEKIMPIVKVWSKKSNFSDLENSLILTTKNPINGNKLMVEELANFKDSVEFASKVTEELDSIIKSYETENFTEKPVEVYPNAEEILTKYLVSMPLGGQEDIKKVLSNLNPINIDIKEIDTKELGDFKEKYLLPEEQSEFSRFTNRAIARNTNATINAMTDYFSSEKAKDFYSPDSPKKSLESLYEDKGDKVPVMTFPEAIQKHLKTGEKKWNTVDNIYFEIKVNDEVCNVVLSGLNAVMPKTEKEGMQVFEDALQGIYKGKAVETIVDDELETNSARNHSFIAIYNGKLGESNYYPIKDWTKNTFVSLNNGGTNNLEDFAKSYGYEKLGSFHKLKKIKGDLRGGCRVHLGSGSNALDGDGGGCGGRFRG